MNEEEKKAIERLEEQLNFWKKQNIKNSDCEIILNLITKLQKENEEKDKIINLMAKYIAKEDKTNKFCDYKTVCDNDCEECVEAYFKESE